MLFQSSAISRSAAMPLLSRASTRGEARENPSAADSEAGWKLMAIRTLRRRSCRCRYRGAEAHVRSAVTEVLHPRFKNRIEMARIKRNEEIQTFAIIHRVESVARRAFTSRS